MMSAKNLNHQPKKVGESPAINGVTWGPYKWLTGIITAGVISPFITGDGAHLVERTTVVVICLSRARN